MSARYAIGVDLGTTNCVLSYASLADDQATPQLLSIPQLVAAGTVESHKSLPSFTYLAPDHEATGGLDLPWAEQSNFSIGQMARRQSAETPTRTVAAAKSWLCHSRVNRRDAILPWEAPAEVEKISPVTASQRYLEHLIAAWNDAFPDDSFQQQIVVLTVPASFDAVARELTRDAAVAAGFPAEMILLEEPQAALYAWLTSTGDHWRKLLKVDDRLLVCDVGGGTTDLTLISIADEDGELTLRREAVGRHLLVGGDNMDLALAHFVAQKFDKEGVKLDAWQSVSLWHSCRAAKEALLADDDTDTHTISVLGRGSKLIGGTVSVEVNRKEVAKFLVDGFLPQCEANEHAQRQRASGFQEIGLPFESDTGITRHISEFLSLNSDDAGEPLHPQHVLFNGGVFKAATLRDRLLKVMGGWSDSGIAPLDGEQDLDHSVARGAAFYGWSKQHGGVRIRGGAARSYYVGIETAGLAIPGAPRPLRGLCVVPFGMEEGTEVAVPSNEIGLVLGEQAHFRFFSSPVRKDDQPGTILDQWSEEELQETDSLEAELPKNEDSDESYVPVRFESRITELGMFELWCAATTSDDRWKLEFSVRDED